MSVDPTSNPIPPSTPISPVAPTQPVTPGSSGNEQRAFSLGEPSENQKNAEGASGYPSPIEAAQDAAEQNQKNALVTAPQLQDQISKLQESLKQAGADLKNPQKLAKLTQDHYQALLQVTTEMNPPMRTIAKETNSTFAPPQLGSDQSLLNHVANWINGSQQTLSQAFNFLSQQKNPSPSSFMKLQYAMQRAVQRGELFSSIIGSSVSGIKTLLSTQLG